MASYHEGEPVWIRKLKEGGSYPLKELHSCQKGWCNPPANMFQVRGPDYLETKTKMPGGEFLLKPIAFDWIKSPRKIFDIMRNSNGRVREALDEILSNQKHHGEIPFIWAINLQVPSKENHSLIMYYASFSHPKKGSLVQQFLDGDNSFRNSRFKLIANVVEGPLIVRTTVSREAVCLLGKAVSCSYSRDVHFMEIDVDIGGSFLAKTIVNLAFGYVTSLTVDLAFLIEGQTAEELPERILGSIRFANLDPACASFLESPLQERVQPGRFWSSLRNFINAGHQDPVANVEEDELGTGA